MQYHELRGVMLECDVELERDAAAVEGYGLRAVRALRRRGSAPRSREMVARQAQKRVGLRFIPTRTVSWDHRKLGGSY